MKESLHILNTESADPTLLERWLVIAHQRMKDVHANRYKEWALARLCLEKCFHDLGYHLKPHEFVFKNENLLEGFQHLSFSLSHSKNWAAAFVGSTQLARLVGVDIELKNRKVPDNVKHRLTNKSDQIKNPLELWVIKEAAFKSLPRLAQEGIWLNNLVVKESSFELEGSPFKGSFELQEHTDVLVAKAYCQ